MSVRIVAVSSPPMTTVARGRCTSAPSLVERAIGMKPSDATNAVMMTGRSRSIHPSTIRFRTSVIPSFSKVLNCPISTMPLSTATPNSAMKPTPAEMLNGMSRSHNAHTPPMADSGMAENTNSVSRTFFYVAYSRQSLTNRASGTASMSRPVAS